MFNIKRPAEIWVAIIRNKPAILTVFGCGCEFLSNGLADVY